ncbi:hypothetical protein B0H15DRAFT_848244 [Mycena belliarum]|uniref:Uncharacterized protein n=1 Tax=Mycena belliarum TaxID=1033014 RepID=A0AAD6U119_9AGAR|nr:hypothetical protein B0H15DRAFT_848244 [Mycena belliae]
MSMCADERVCGCAEPYLLCYIYPPGSAPRWRWSWSCQNTARCALIVIPPTPTPPTADPLAAPRLFLRPARRSAVLCLCLPTYIHIGSHTTSHHIITEPPRPLARSRTPLALPTVVFPFSWFFSFFFWARRVFLAVRADAYTLLVLIVHYSYWYAYWLVVFFCVFFRAVLCCTVPTVWRCSLIVSFCLLPQPALACSYTYTRTRARCPFYAYVLRSTLRSRSTSRLFLGSYRRV